MKKFLTIMILAAYCTVLSAQSGIITDPVLFVYKLHGQTRKYQYSFKPCSDGMVITWGIERNTKWQSGTFTLTGKALENAECMSFLQPVDGEHLTLPDSMTYHVILSKKAFADLKSNGTFTYDGIRYDAEPATETFTYGQGQTCPLIHVHDTAEGADMWILDNPDFPLICKMINNPLEINWSTF